MSDSKPEVRTIATATLAGMIKGMSDAEAAALRAEALTKARRLLLPAAGPKRAAPGGSTTPSTPPTNDASTLLLKHGAVLVRLPCTYALIKSYVNDMTVYGAEPLPG